MVSGHTIIGGNLESSKSVLTGLPVRAEHVGDTLVDVWGQSPVEPYLVPADGLTGFASGVVQGAQLHRLPEFEYMITEEDH